MERQVRSIVSPGGSTNWQILSQINLTENLTMHEGENILHWDSGAEDPNRMLVFTNSNLISFARQSTNFQMDGTFKLCPRVYNNGLTSKGQLYTVHARKNGILIPCAYALMAKKSAQEYVRLFSKLEELFAFAPQKAMISTGRSL